MFAALETVLATFPPGVEWLARDLRSLAIREGQARALEIARCVPGWVADYHAAMTAERLKWHYRRR